MCHILLKQLLSLQATRALLPGDRLDTIWDPWLCTCPTEVEADSLEAQGNSAFRSPGTYSRKAVGSCTREVFRQACGAAASAMRKADLAAAKKRDMAAIKVPGGRQQRRCESSMLATVSTHVLQVVMLLTLRPLARVDLALQKIKDLARNVTQREAFQQRLVKNLPAGPASAGASTPRPPSPGRAGGSADRGDPSDAPAPDAPLPPEPIQQQVLFPALRTVRTPYHLSRHARQEHPAYARTVSARALPRDCWTSCAGWC